MVSASELGRPGLVPRALFVLLLALGALSAQGEPAETPNEEAEAAPAKAAVVPVHAWTFGRVVTGTGEVFAPGVIVVKAGRIEAIGAVGSTEIPEGAVRHEALAHSAWPGFVQAASLVYSGAEGFAAGSANDQADRGVLADEGPSWEQVESFLRSGFTTALVIPTGGGFNGRGSIVKPVKVPDRDPFDPAARGRGPDKAAVLRVEHAALSMGFTRGTRSKKLFEDALANLKKYLADKAAYDKAVEEAKKKPEAKPAEAPKEGEAPKAEEKKPEEKKPEEGKPEEKKLPDEPKADAKLLVLREHLEGRLPGLLALPSAADYLHFQGLFAKEPRLRPALLWPPDRDGAPVRRVLDEVVKLEVPVVLSPTPATAPRKADLQSPARDLLDRGVPVALIPSQPRGGSLMAFRMELLELVRMGIPEAEVLRAVTLTPAEILGLADRVGSLATGKEADFLVLDGDLFAPTTRLQKVIVGGEVVFEPLAGEDL